jgi:hypothetical protein
VALLLLQEQQNGNILPALIWLRFCRLEVSLMSCATLLAISGVGMGHTLLSSPLPSSLIGWMCNIFRISLIAWPMIVFRSGTLLGPGS